MLGQIAGGNTAVHPGAVGPAGSPLVEGDHDQGLRQVKGRGLKGAVGELGARIFGVRLGRGQGRIGHEAGTEG